MLLSDGGRPVTKSREINYYKIPVVGMNGTQGTVVTTLTLGANLTDRNIFLNIVV